MLQSFQALELKSLTLEFGQRLKKLRGSGSSGCPSVQTLIHFGRWVFKKETFLECRSLGVMALYVFNNQITFFLTCVLKQITDDLTACKEQKVRYEMKQSGVTVVPLHAVTSSVIYYNTHARKNVIYFFYTINIQMVYWIFGHEKSVTIR